MTPLSPLLRLTPSGGSGEAHSRVDGSKLKNHSRPVRISDLLKNMQLADRGKQQVTIGCREP